MLKEIKYGGFTANPNDHDSVEGDLSVAMNLVPEDGTVRPVLPPNVVFTIPTGSTIMCIHKTAAYTHYILWNEDAHTLSYMEKQGDTYTATTITLGITLSGVVKVEPIGNTLVVLADDGIHYILWKNNNYNYLGSHLPELDLEFTLIDGKEYESDEHKVTIIDDPLVDGDANIPVEFEFLNGDDERCKTAVSNIRQAIMASLNQVAAESCEDKRFAFPLFVRYGYRMYNSSITMHSAPILVVPSLNEPVLQMGWEISNDRLVVTGPARIKATLYGYKLHCKPMSVDQLEELALWSDIISSVDIFISPQFYTYNQGAKDREIVIGPGTAAPKNERLNTQICENGTFYLVKQARVSSTNPQRNKLLQRYGDDVRLDFEPTNDNIVVRELMTDDYGTHDGLMAEESFVYNSRLNLAGVSRQLFNGFSPGCMWHKVGDALSNFTKATVVIETDGREITVRSHIGVVYYAQRQSKVLWFYYPHTGAKRAYLTIDNQNIELELTQHSTLNGAYYCSLDEDAAQQVVSTIPEPSSDEERIMREPNKVYTSDVNNPFYFPLDGINSIGYGRILGLCAAVRPVSTGQMGYADLYIFADSGVWVAKINEKGTYSNISLATGDICINPDSITQMETTVLFATARGIMLISGSQAQCISEAINDGDVPPENGMQTVMDAFTQLGRSYPTIAPFRDFLGGEDASLRMLYDYCHQRIIVYNPAYSYAYIYSLESHKWGMMESDIQYTINSYPDALAVTGDNVLVNYSDSPVGDGSAVAIPALLVTRPLTLDMPDVLKTVRRVIQRGMFRRWQGGEHMTAILYGSRDLYDWHLIYASNGERMQGFSGTPYKWFRVALVLNIDGNESITGATVELIDKLNNRPR